MRIIYIFSINGRHLVFSKNVLMILRNNLGRLARSGGNWRLVRGWENRMTPSGHLPSDAATRWLNNSFTVPQFVLQPSPGKGVNKELLQSAFQGWHDHLVNKFNMNILSLLTIGVILLASDAHGKCYKLYSCSQSKFFQQKKIRNGVLVVGESGSTRCV